MPSTATTGKLKGQPPHEKFAEGGPAACSAYELRQVIERARERGDEETVRKAERHLRRRTGG